MEKHEIEIKQQILFHWLFHATERKINSIVKLSQEVGVAPHTPLPSGRIK